MNNNFDFASKKTMLILLFICMIFFLLIIKAFDYLPDEQDMSNNENNEELVYPNHEVKTENINKTEDQVDSSKDDDSDNEISEQDEALKVEQKNTNEELKDVQASSKVRTPEPTEALIPIEEGVSDLNSSKIQENTPPNIEDSARQSFEKAVSLKQNGEYDAALEVYRSILANDSNKKYSAQCYEDMANIFAIQKRFGSALVYAQKANKIEKTPSRERLIQTLLQKTGMQTGTRSN